MRFTLVVGSVCPMRLNGNSGKAPLIEHHPLSKQPEPLIGEMSFGQDAEVIEQGIS